MWMGIISSHHMESSILRLEGGNERPHPCTEVKMKVNFSGCDYGHYSCHHYFSQGLPWGRLQSGDLDHRFYLNNEFASGGVGKQRELGASSLLTLGPQCVSQDVWRKLISVSVCFLVFFGWHIPRPLD